MWDVPYVSKVTFSSTIIGLKLQFFLRFIYLPVASGASIMHKATIISCTVRVFTCPKWCDCFAAIIPDRTGSVSRNLELFEGNRKTEYTETPAVCFTFSFCVDDFGVELVLKDNSAFTTLDFRTNRNDFKRLQCLLGLGDICIFLCSMKGCGAALPGSSPREKAWLWKGEFPASLALGKRPPGPLVIWLLSLLYQVNLEFGYGAKRSLMLCALD